MKKLSTLLLVAIMAATFAGTTKAETGIGLQFGEPVSVGLSLRFDNIAIGAGWKLGDNGYLAVDADYWIGKNNLAKQLDWFWGLGAGVRLGDPFRLDARVPVGLQWMPDQKWEIFGQVAPSLRIIDEIGFQFSGAIGVRYIL